MRTPALPQLSAGALLLLHRLFLDGTQLERAIQDGAAVEETVAAELVYREDSWLGLTIHGHRTATAAGSDWLKGARELQRASAP